MHSFPYCGCKQITSNLVAGGPTEQGFINGLCGPRLSQWRNQEVAIAEEVTVTEGYDPGKAVQECSRHGQDRLGVVRSQGEREDSPLHSRFL